MCEMHWRRWRKHGDPLLIGKSGPKNLRPAEERFWEKVDKRGPNECWVWKPTGGTAWYGVVWIDGRNVPATHVAMYLSTGTWPTLFVCHRCDNPPCVNPAHLDNARDMAAKGRWNNQHTAKTHCIHGHPLSGDNVRVDKHGTRHCRECARRRNREYEERRTRH